MHLTTYRYYLKLKLGGDHLSPLRKLKQNHSTNPLSQSEAYQQHHSEKQPNETGPIRPR